MTTESQAQALAQIAPSRTAFHDEIESAIEQSGGLACFELQVLLDSCHKSMTGRLSELRKDGRIKDSGISRVNPEITTHTVIQTVWVIGDDRDKVRADDVKRLRKLAARLGFGLIEPEIMALYAEEKTS